MFFSPERLAADKHTMIDPFKVSVAALLNKGIDNDNKGDGINDALDNHDFNDLDDCDELSDNVDGYKP